MDALAHLVDTRVDKLRHVLRERIARHSNDAHVLPELAQLAYGPRSVDSVHQWHYLVVWKMKKTDMVRP